MPTSTPTKDNDFLGNHPELAIHWDSEKNDRSPGEVTRSSNKKRWFNCKLGHSFSVSPNRATQGSWCPYCSGKRIIIGFNDLFTTNPEVVDLWSVNNTLDPYTVSKGSKKKATWICTNGHLWVAAIYSITSGTRCPACSGNTTTRSTSLEATHPELAIEWDTARNDRPPAAVSYGSDYRAWWVCEADPTHTWRTKVCHRTNPKTESGCPNCANRAHKMQYDFTEAVKNIIRGIEVITDCRGICRGYRELDVYIPSLKIAIEFNGLYWHSDDPKLNSAPVKEKMEDCAEKGIDLYVVWEDDWRDNRPRVENWLRGILTPSTGQKEPIDVKVSSRYEDRTSITVKYTSHTETIEISEDGAISTDYVSTSGLREVMRVAKYLKKWDKLRFEADLCRDKGSQFIDNSWELSYSGPKFWYIVSQYRIAPEGVDRSTEGLLKVWNAGSATFTWWVG